MSRYDDTRRILLALFASECPQATLFRAQSLSLVLGAELHVLRVVPPFTPKLRIFPRKVGLAEARGALTGLLDARSRTRTFLSDGLGKALPKGRLKLRSGDFFEQVELRARELGATLIVLAPEGPSDRCGRKVTQLARATGAPVLVARDAGVREAIVAATDLRTKAVPVLRKAAELSERLGAPLVAVHNLNPELVSVGPDMAVQLALPAESKISTIRRQLLRDVSQDLRVESEAVLTNELDPVHAVLGEARARDADLIVVGTRGRGFLERLLTRSISAEIVRRARRSVLVTPLSVEPVSSAVATGWKTKRSAAAARLPARSSSALTA